MRQFIVIAFFAAGHIAHGQSSSFSFDVHANTNVSAADIGFEVYPGAVLNQRGHEDAAFDLGLTLNSSRYRLRGVKYLSPDARADVLAFYRNALSRYGQVLECDHGRAVGEVTRTDSGLTCRVDVDGDNDRVIESEHDLRVGSPHNFRLIGLDDARQPTAFVLMLVEIPHRH